MARQKAGQEGGNKSAAVREILDRNPNTPTKDIVAILAQRGIRIHPNLVYLIKSKSKAMRRRQTGIVQRLDGDLRSAGGNVQGVLFLFVPTTRFGRDRSIIALGKRSTIGSQSSRQFSSSA
jgi:hypothetical protein